MKTPISCLFLVLSLICFGIQGHSQQAAIQHVEPPFWWTGMKNTNLQVMVHGQNIGTTIPEIRYEGLRVDSMVRPGNKNFLFIYLSILPEAQPGSFNIRFFRDGKPTASYNYKLLSRKTDSEARKGFTSSDVIYLITPDRFANGDPGNDSSPLTSEKASRSDKNGRHGGDI